VGLTQGRCGVITHIQRPRSTLALDQTLQMPCRVQPRGDPGGSKPIPRGSMSDNPPRARWFSNANACSASLHEIALGQQIVPENPVKLLCRTRCIPNSSSQFCGRLGHPEADEMNTAPRLIDTWRSTKLPALDSLSSVRLGGDLGLAADQAVGLLAGCIWSCQFQRYFSKRLFDGATFYDSGVLSTSFAQNDHFLDPDFLIWDTFSNSRYGILARRKRPCTIAHPETVLKRANWAP
jgi:hypothetical protein